MPKLEALAKVPVRCYTFLKNREVFIMQFFTDSNMQFPLVELSLNQGETVFIQRGSMVYHTPNVTLSTKLNASGSGLGRFVKAVGRSMVSGESSFITQVVSQSNNGYIAWPLILQVK